MGLRRLLGAFGDRFAPVGVVTLAMICMTRRIITPVLFACTVVLSLSVAGCGDGGDDGMGSDDGADSTSGDGDGDGDGTESGDGDGSSTDTGEESTTGEETGEEDSGESTGDQMGCDWPMEVDTPRLLHLCEPTSDTNCRTFVPVAPADPRCGDTDDPDFTTARNNEPNTNTIMIFKDWVPVATSHGSINAMNDLVSQIPDETEVTVTFDDGNGTEWDFVLSFNRADASTTLVSFTQK